MSADSKNSGAVAVSTASASGSAAAAPATALPIADRLKKFTAPTVWHEFTPLAQQSKAVNLGQGFPGWSPPEFVTAHAADAVKEVGTDFMVHQYSRSAGDMSLCNSLAKRYSAKFSPRTIDPLTEVVTTNGATEAIFISLMGLLNPGDEVVTIEPAFDIYSAQTDMAGAVLRTVPLRVVTDAKSNTARWHLDMKEFETAFTAKTRILLLNTPHNPTGKVFTRAELDAIRDIVVKRFPRVIVIADEVYEPLTYEHAHVHIATLPDMWERTISIGSAGKMFSVTGWKIGWCIAPAPLIRCLSIAHQWDVFSVNSICQVAIAKSLATAELPYNGHANYYVWLREWYRAKRTRLADALKAGGITPVMPEGGFFIMGDTSGLTVPASYAADTTVTRDWSLCRYLTKEIGVAAIPPSSFYADSTKGLAANFARFAFCKPDAVLDEAALRLTKLKSTTATATATAAAK